jgi:hypothetical protein
MKPLGNLVNTTAASNLRNEYSVKRLVSIETKGPLTSLIMDGIGLLVLVFGRAAKEGRGDTGYSQRLSPDFSILPSPRS